MSLSDAVRGLTTRRVRDLSPPEAQPSPFAVAGGWGAATDAAGARLDDDPVAAERSARAEGARALAALERDRLEERRAAMNARLGHAARGRNYSEHA
jgi:hypothetical protein